MREAEDTSFLKLKQQPEKWGRLGYLQQTKISNEKAKRQRN